MNKILLALAVVAAVCVVTMADASNPNDAPQQNPLKTKDTTILEGGKDNIPGGGKDNNLEGGKDNIPGGGKDNNPEGGKDNNPEGGKGTNQGDVKDKNTKVPTDGKDTNQGDGKYAKIPKTLANKIRKLQPSPFLKPQPQNLPPQLSYPLLHLLLLAPIMSLPSNISYFKHLNMIQSTL
uniref:Secreted protein n=1 Tax=Panagrellus redivivus TaxID=6233 RepID=A0A7E4VWB0_PANRE